MNNVSTSSAAGFNSTGHQFMITTLLAATVSP